MAEPETTRVVLRDVVDELIDRTVRLTSLPTYRDGTGSTYDIAVRDRTRYIRKQAALLGNLSWRLLTAERIADLFAATDPQELRAELVRTIALLVEWTEAIDRRGATIDG